MQANLFLDAAPAGGGANILNRIANVKPANDQRVSSTDIAVCERYQARYLEVKANLQKWEDIFSMAVKEYYNGAVKVSRYHHGDIHIEVENKGRDRLDFAHDDYDAVKGWEVIDKKLIELRSSYINKVLGWFNSTYNLEVEGSDLIKKGTEDYREVIDYIFARTGGLDLKDQGFRNLVKKIQHATYYQSRVKLVGNRLELADMYMYEGYSKESFPWSYKNNSTFFALFASLSYFEDGELDDFTIGCQLPLGKEVDFTTPYEFRAEKVIKARFFKNKKVIIYFKDATTAQQYYEMYELSNLPDK